MKYFNIHELDCQYTGENNMDPEFLEKLDQLREACDFPFVITSGYRDKTHPVERTKAQPGTGTHCQGIAADIAVATGEQRGKIIQEAIRLGFRGIGVAKGFVHVDARESENLIMWSY